jgi:hypothetical protein
VASASLDGAIAAIYASPEMQEYLAPPPEFQAAASPSRCQLKTRLRDSGRAGILTSARICSSWRTRQVRYVGSQKRIDEPLSLRSIGPIDRKKVSGARSTVGAAISFATGFGRRRGAVALRVQCRLFSESGDAVVAMVLAAIHPSKRSRASTKATNLASDPPLSG